MQKHLVTLALILLSSTLLAAMPKFQTYPLTSPQPALTQQKRTHDFPTQVIRMQVDLSADNLFCATIFQDLNLHFFHQLKQENLRLRGRISCILNEKGKADRVDVAASVDPLTDAGIAFLQQYRAEYNGMDFYGQPFNIQSAKGVIVQLTVDLGTMDNAAFTPLSRFYAPAFFTNLYQMETLLVADIENTITDQKSFVLAFMKKWGNVEDLTYFKSVFSKSNFIKITPEPIFLMHAKESVYKPPHTLVYSYPLN